MGTSGYLRHAGPRVRQTTYCRCGAILAPDRGPEGLGSLLCRPPGRSRTQAAVIVGIDASNLRHGGGITHLVELLRAAKPELDGFTRIIVWSGRATLVQLEERPWLTKCHEGVLDGELPGRVLWQRFRLSTRA